MYGLYSRAASNQERPMMARVRYGKRFRFAPSFNNARYDETISRLFPNRVFFLQQLKYLSYNELTDKMSNLDQEMEREIDDLRRRYHAKRQPILDAMDQKRKRQQNF